MPPDDQIPSKEVRLAEFFRRLDAAEPATSFEDAYKLLCTTLDQVEDELTGIPNEPAQWKTSGRLFPPQQDRMSSIKGTDVKRFDSLRHVTYIAGNGAIEIRSSARGQIAVLYAKPGSDGRAIGDVWPPLRNSNL